MRVGYINLAQHVIHGPEVLDGSTPVHHDDQGSFPADIVYEKLEEGINGKCFVYVSNRVDKCGGSQ
jgi:hypothetical protein